MCPKNFFVSPTMTYKEKICLFVGGFEVDSCHVIHCCLCLQVTNVFFSTSRMNHKKGKNHSKALCHCYGIFKQSQGKMLICLVWICLATIFTLSSLLGWDAWFKSQKKFKSFEIHHEFYLFDVIYGKKEHIQLCNS